MSFPEIVLADPQKLAIGRVIQKLGHEQIRNKANYALILTEIFMDEFSRNLSESCPRNMPIRVQIHAKLVVGKIGLGLGGLDLPENVVFLLFNIFSIVFGSIFILIASSSLRAITLFSFRNSG